jgi:hypothetical protein
MIHQQNLSVIWDLNKLGVMSVHLTLLDNGLNHSQFKAFLNEIESKHGDIV